MSPTLAGLIIAAGAVGWATGSWVQSRVPSTQNQHRRLILVATPLVATAPVGALLLALELVPLGVVAMTSVVAAALTILLATRSPKPLPPRWSDPVTCDS